MKKAVVSGINYVQDPENTLQGCINDAHNIMDLLIKQYGFQRENIHLLCDCGSDVDGYPSDATILSEIQWLVNGAQSGDSLVFTYSGHGTQVDEPDSVKDGPDDAICPADMQTAGFISDDVLRAQLANSVPEGAKLTVVLDACHSGTMMDLRYNLVPKCKLNQSLTSTFVCHGEMDQTVGTVIALSGCKDSQTSSDTIENNVHQGALTWALLAVLQAHNYKVSCLDLLHEVQDMMKQHHYDQTPQLSMGSMLDPHTSFSFA